MKTLSLLLLSTALVSAAPVTDRASRYENGVIPTDAAQRLAVVKDYLSRSDLKIPAGHLAFFHLTEGDRAGSYDIYFLGELNVSKRGRVTKNVGSDRVCFDADVEVKSVAAQKINLHGRVTFTNGRAVLSYPFEGAVNRHEMHSMGGGVMHDGRANPQQNIYLAVLF